MAPHPSSPPGQKGGWVRGARPRRGSHLAVDQKRWPLGLAGLMTAFGENSGLVDTYNIAVEAKTLVKEVSVGNVDHIYAPPSTAVYRYEMLDGVIMQDMTDHFAKYADVSW